MADMKKYLVLLFSMMSSGSPFSTPAPKRSIVQRLYYINNPEGHEQAEILEGSSPKVVKLRKELQAVWNSNKTSPIVLLGPRGSGKASLAQELVYHLPSWQTEQVVQLSMDDCVNHVETLLGNRHHPGILDEITDRANTTVVILGFRSQTSQHVTDYENKKAVSNALIQILSEGSFYSVYDGKVKQFQPRLALTCTHESLLNVRLDDDVTVVKVPSLESRKADLKEIATQKLRHLAPKFGLVNVQLSRQATHRLLDHRWEIGEAELDQELCNALELLQQEDSNGSVIEARHILVNSLSERMRHRLLYEYPVLRKIISSPWVFDHTLRYIVTPAFAAILMMLFFGAQTREHSTALTVFWAGWWPAAMLIYPFLGRIWCSVCPFMAVGNLAQEFVVGSLGIELKRKWPEWMHRSGAAFAFGLFFVILMWEELWDLPQNGVLSAWLLLLITSGAVFNSVQYEGRAWCRFLCPIGAMNRIFGTFSMMEVRTWKANCQGCTKPTCLKGNSIARVDPSDAVALRGCAMKLKNNQLRSTGECSLCMTCVKSCERESPELNLRPVGLDYGLPWLLPKTFQRPEILSVSQVETNFWLGALATVLQGSVLVHYMPVILQDFGLDPSIADASPALDASFAAHCAATAVLLALPGCLSLLADTISVPLEKAIHAKQYQLDAKENPDEQQAIIDFYLAIAGIDADLSESVRGFDLDEDGMISLWESQRAFEQLGFGSDQHDILVRTMERHFGSEDSTPIAIWLDRVQDIYLSAMEAKSDLELKRKLQLPELRTKKTFVEIFNELDTTDKGFLNKEEFTGLAERGYLDMSMPKEYVSHLFDQADIVKNGRLTLFEFMGVMRKTVAVGIQEIGYGYLPLAWASLTAYWLSVGMKELGLLFARLPDTFFIDSSIHLPAFVASDSAVHVTQMFLMLGSIPFSIALTQKLCDDNRIGSVRFGLHATIQVVGALFTLYLMLYSNSVPT